MNLSVSHQANVFLLCFLCGVIVGLIFDAFRISRRFIKTGVAVTFIQDLIFCLLTLIALFLFAVRFNYGEIRWYMIFAVFLGGVLYFVTISKVIIKVAVLLIRLIVKILLIPVKILTKLLRKPIIFTVKLGKISWNKLKIKFLPFKKYINVLKKQKNVI